METIKDKKINVMILGDDPRHVSGVAHCLRDIGTALLNTGKFNILSLGAAMMHPDPRPVQFKPEWFIVPVEGFGNIEQVKSLAIANKIDVILMQSDPRFYDWFLCRDNEIRCNIPIVWYTIWDNYPYPIFNDWIWNSVDVSVAISKLTEDLIKTVSLKTQLHYMPHCVNPQSFKKLPRVQVEEFRNNNLPFTKDKFTIFWNNRNGRRKNGASLIAWFKTFLEQVGEDKAILLMHTDPIDPNGFNLPELIKGFDLDNKVFINASKVDESILTLFYNCADCTINISNAEGFGMGTLESLSCGTPIIATWTGGMREQLCDNIDNPKEFYGVPVFPAVKVLTGSPELPWIYEDQVNEEDTVNAMKIMFSLSPEERKKWGEMGMKHVRDNFNFYKFESFWPDLFTKIHAEFGSWPTNKFQKWTIEEIETCQQKFDSTKKPTNLPPSTTINMKHFEAFFKTLNLKTQI